MALRKGRALSATVDAWLSTAFRWLATAVTARPLMTITLMTFLALALAPGMFLGETENNGEKLWVPQDTESQEQQSWVKGTFGVEERRARVYSTNRGANMLNYESLIGLEKLQAGLVSVTADCDIGSCAGKTVSYNDVRAKQRSSILSIWGDKAPALGVDILADVNNEAKWLSTDGDKLKMSDMLGGVQYDNDGTIISAEAFLTTFWLKNEIEPVDGTDIDPSSEAWELKFDEYVNEFEYIGLLENYPWTVKGQQEAGGNAISGDVRMLSFGYIFLIVFSVVVLSHRRRVQSNGVIALASVLSVGFSIISTFGICGYLGVKQNPVTTILYLVLLGIGVDDCYVIMEEYSRATGMPRDRVVQAMAKAGTSIAVTSMTDTVAFAAGVSSSLPALRDFCIFAAVGIFFDFLFQCTFLVAILVYRARATADNRPDWICCIQVDPESTCCGNTCCRCIGENKNGEVEGLTQKALNRITKWTLTPIGSIVVVVVTLALVTGSVLGLPNLKTNFDQKWFTPADAAYTDVYEVQEKYFPTSGGLPVYIFTQSGQHAAAHKDGSLAALYQRVSSCSSIDRSVGNWYVEFAKDTARSARSEASEAAFAYEVKAFVSSPSGARFAKDLIFDTETDGQESGIRASRALYIMVESQSGEDDIRMTKSVRSCVDRKPLNAFPFATPFLYFDGLAVVDNETIQNVIVACACVFIVNLIMLADVFAASLVLVMVGLVDICILGYMAHWNLDFNSVTAINLVLAVGLAVDYSAHIAHSFLVCKGSGRDRALQAVDHIGTSVFNGAFSTFLAVLPLSMSKSYVFTVLFKMWFMIILFGIYFGIVVLPVLLRLAAPCIGEQAASQDSPNNEKQDASTHAVDVDAPPPHILGPPVILGCHHSIRTAKA
mmetsp:Transcript_31411/g.55522  ORF Transcript_31411/g.55522 Transcript_31411/m.55522 type:complete len:888 (-) Transcript_31411:376-3039(-)